MESSKESVVHYARGLFLASFAAFIFTSMMTSAMVGGSLIDEHLGASVGSARLASVKALPDLRNDECDDYRSVNCRRDEMGGGGSGVDTTGWVVPVGASAVLSVTPEIIEPGQMVTVSWETQEIKSCIVTEDGKEISKYTDYTNLRRGPLSAETVYALSCLGEAPNSKIDKTVTVKVEAVTGAPTVAITADPAVVDYNGATRISWQSVGADSCAIFKNGVEVGRGNSYEAKNILADALFKVRCSNKNGSVADTIEVSVRPPRAPEITLSVDTPTVAYNSTAKITWSTEYANSCTLKVGKTNFSSGISGTKSLVALKADTDILLSCLGAAGTKTVKELSIIVAKPEAPTVTITAEPASVAYEGKTKVTWVSTHADTCTMTAPGMRRTGLSGAYETPVLTKNMTYLVSCSGPGGKIDSKVDVQVLPPTRPTVSLSVVKNQVAANESVEFTWESTAARTCSVYKNQTAVKAGVSGSYTTSLASPNTAAVVWVSCVGAGGSVVAAQTIHMNEI